MKIWITLAIAAIAGTSLTAATTNTKSIEHNIVTHKMKKPLDNGPTYTGYYNDGISTYSSTCSGPGCTQECANLMAYYKSFSY
jgi:hypothetical protein